MIAVSQTLWLVIQMIVRSGRHLEVSQLEIGTAAFTSSAIMMYALNWHKPKSAGVPWTLWSFAGPMPVEISRLLHQTLENQCLLVTLMGEDGKSSWMGLLQPRWNVRGSFIPNSHRYLDGGKRSNNWWLGRPEILGFILTNTAFGAIHFTAVKSTFPSYSEKIVWCIASAICTGVAPLMITSMVLVVFIVGRGQRNFNFFLNPMTFPRLVILLYVFTRLFLIVELFRCLFFLPPSAFVATWASKIPHVS